MGDNYKILKSGSSGNCILLRNYIALDMGISYSLIKPYIKDLKLVFISHCHKDHLLPSTVRTLAFNKPNLKWCVGRFLVDTLLELGVKPKNIFVLDVGKKYDLGAIEVEPVELHHDVENFGYKIIFKKDNYKVIYCVDTSSMDGIEAKNYDLYLIEANYSDEELEQRIEKQIENAEFVVGMRVANTHLSQGQWADFIMSNAKDTSEAVMIHQHKEKGEK